MNTTSAETLLRLTSSDKLRKLAPCYLFNPDRFSAAIRNYKKAFKARFPKVILGYSFKTNEHTQVITEAHKNGMMAEVVSPKELTAALNNGYCYKDIIYNGVIPDDKEKYDVARNGGIVNIENYNEAKRIEAIARNKDTHIKVGLRINISFRDVPSRFGIVPYSDEWNKLFELQKYGSIKVVGIHAHITDGRFLDAWHRRGCEIGRIAKAINAEYIDFGSNMFSQMDSRMAVHYNGGKPIPSFDDYAEALYTGLAKIYGSTPDLPTIVLEPGTPIISEAVDLLARVTSTRERNGIIEATANCSRLDFGFLGTRIKPPVDVITSSGLCDKASRIFGYTCLEDDVLCDSFPYSLKTDDIILFRNVGAYSLGLSNNFIMPPLDMYKINLAAKTD